MNMMSNLTYSENYESIEVVKCCRQGFVVLLGD
jgi:hypothetical protein